MYYYKKIKGDDRVSLIASSCEQTGEGLVEITEEEFQALSGKEE